jgi:hypothetical protein
MQTKYLTNTGLVTSSISGGRLHHTFRPLQKATATYDYEVGYGENFHTLSALVFGDDAEYWVLQDINAPKDAFAFECGDKVKLPMDMVRDSVGTNKFF